METNVIEIALSLHIGASYSSWEGKQNKIKQKGGGMHAQ